MTYQNKTEPRHNLIDVYLHSPLSGLTPWIAMSLIVGPGRFEEAASVALGLSLLSLALGHRSGGRVKKLELFDVTYFAIVAIIGLFATAGVISWMELWSGEMTNIALVVFAFGSLLLRNPFTLEYAKEQVPADYWDDPLFLRVNYRITLVWALSFAFSAAVGLIGCIVLHTSDNFWTGWILQIGAMLFAVAFTEWYPDVAPNKAAETAGTVTAPPAPLIKLFEWVPVFVGITGAALLITDSGPVWLGVVLLVAAMAGHLSVRVLVRRSAVHPAT